jgi:hypothetical protein
MGADSQSLEQLATEANARLDRAKVAEDRAKDLRISAGQILAEAKDRVRAGEPGHTNWAKWVRENIKHSYRDANKCIAIARSPDPNAALAAERETARVSMALSRAKMGQTFAPPSASSVATERTVTLETVKEDVLRLRPQDREILVGWLLTLGNGVQRDQCGNVLDPLVIRLRRVLHRLRKGSRQQELIRTPSQYEQEIYDELSHLSLLLPVENYNTITDLYDCIKYLVSDLTKGNDVYSIYSQEHQDGMRELEMVVDELTAPMVTS